MWGTGTFHSHTSQRIAHTSASHASSTCTTHALGSFFCSCVVCLDTIIPSFLQFILKRLHVHIHTLPWIVGPRNYQRQENVLSLHNLSGGRLSGMTNTGQQLYWAAIIPNTLNPSVLMATRGCLGSAALSLCNASKCFHAKASEVCPNIGFPSASSLVLLPNLCHVIYLAVSLTMKRC